MRASRKIRYSHAIRASTHKHTMSGEVRFANLAPPTHTHILNRNVLMFARGSVLTRNSGYTGAENGTA